jgi:hypothetical protein
VDVQDVTLAPGDGQRAAELLGDICALYDAVYSRPPFRWTDEESVHHRQSIVGLLANPTFGLATAQAGDGLTGFAYGVRLAPTTGWWHGFEPPAGQSYRPTGSCPVQHHPLPKTGAQGRSSSASAGGSGQRGR